jgi:hypothetical protein
MTHAPSSPSAQACDGEHTPLQRVDIAITRDIHADIGEDVAHKRARPAAKARVAGCGSYISVTGDTFRAERLTRDAPKTARERYRAAKEGACIISFDVRIGVPEISGGIAVLPSDEMREGLAPELTSISAVEERNAPCHAPELPSTIRHPIYAQVQPAIAPEIDAEEREDSTAKEPGTCCGKIYASAKVTASKDAKDPLTTSGRTISDSDPTASKMRTCVREVLASGALKIPAIADAAGEEPQIICEDTYLANGRSIVPVHQSNVGEATEATEVSASLMHDTSVMASTSHRNFGALKHERGNELREGVALELPSIQPAIVLEMDAEKRVTYIKGGGLDEMPELHAPELVYVSERAERKVVCDAPNGPLFSSTSPSRASSEEATSRGLEMCCTLAQPAADSGENTEDPLTDRGGYSGCTGIRSNSVLRMPESRADERMEFFAPSMQDTSLVRVIATCQNLRAEKKGRSCKDISTSIHSFEDARALTSHLTHHPRIQPPTSSSILVAKVCALDSALVQFYSRLFGLVSTIILTLEISYLGKTLVGERTLHWGWAQEGIGTRRSIF